ncbi:dipeptidase [Romboutsia sp.]|uniref:dipeptidase n=1 Tax=Romboutsia sp. TaxID=1965302 RepID=UPI003F3BEE25
MKLIDLHCDTIDKLMDYKGSNLFDNIFSVDIQKLKSANSLVQVFALYFDLELYKNDPFNRFEAMSNKFFEEVYKYKDSISLIKNYDDILKNENENKISAMLSIEEGAALHGKIENLHSVYEIGVRLITLTWNYENEIGYSHSIKGFENEGLKPFGIDTVEAMNELGIIVDVSHLNDGGFYDVAKIAKKPFIASHSNSRTITNVTRNLTDDMIKTLADKGGVTGINFYKAFLGDMYISKVEDMVKHIKHIVNIGGIDVVSMGSDFDGIPNGLEIENISQIEKLQNSLLKSGFSQKDIEKIMYKNALRVIKDVL